GNCEAAAGEPERSVAGEAYGGGVLLARGRALGKSSREGEGFYWVGRASEGQGRPRQAVEYFRRSMAALAKSDAAAEKLKQDMIKRSERLGEEIHEQTAEAQRQGQRTTPDGAPVGPPASRPR